jgi:hypothetical protein
MGSMVRLASPRVADVVPEPDLSLAADQVRLRTMFSGICAGAELTASRGSNPYPKERWDRNLRLFLDGDTTLARTV